MSTQTKSAFTELMYARKSIRKYDADYKLSKEEISEMLTDAMTAPSTSNQQPWRFIAITDESAKKELRGMAYNQEQVETASVVIAVLGDANFHEQAEKINQLSVDAGVMTPEVAVAQTEGSVKLYSGVPVEARRSLAMYDAGLVSMQLLLAAKDRGLDSVVMGGFNKDAFAKAYELPENEFPIVLIAIGKGTGLPRGTSRLSVDDVVKFV
ncbi:nitroreductase family protein [Kurthia zopfii]|uniref:nitroreductase family protein n=1 Tax=Kurthia zopfii TaxID=1650 RepID=UPI000F6E32A2|nr:nitroreductase family protein [Kurthia zopfii]VEI06270.1 Putative NAD(P)H nitroreductase yodC [Kurthia zopfii]